MVSSGLLENTSGGIINNLVTLAKGAVIKNTGVMTNNVDVSGGTLNNAGEMTEQITMKFCAVIDFVSEQHRNYQ